MQLYALDQEDKPIFASHALKGVDYTCCECSSSVRLREGPHRRAHFYHPHATSVCRQNGKSLVHLQIQSHFLEILPSGTCFLEQPFPSIRRIADVVWEKEKIIFEIQCSPISVKEVMERNRDYAQVGYQVVWILHDQRYNKKKVTAAEMWLIEHPHYYTDFDEEEGTFYDQWSSFDQGWRLDRSAKIIVDPTQISRHKSQNGFRTTWPLHLSDDLIDRGEFFEEKLQKTKFRPWHYVRYFYRVFFRHLLEKCCH